MELAILTSAWINPVASGIYIRYVRRVYTTDLDAWSTKPLLICTCLLISSKAWNTFFFPSRYPLSHPYLTIPTEFLSISSVDYNTKVWPTEGIPLSSAFLCFFPIGLLHSPVHLLVPEAFKPAEVDVELWVLFQSYLHWVDQFCCHRLLSDDFFVKGLGEWVSHSGLFSGFLSAVLNSPTVSTVMTDW